MRIVVLDGQTLNPGDLSWNELRALGQCDTYDRSAPEQTVQRARGAELVLTNKTVLSGPIMAQLPGLRYIGVLATGYNVVDLTEACARHVTVTNVPEYGTDSVAQMVFAHVLNFTQRVAAHSDGARGGRWTASEDFCYWDYPLTELAGRTLGLVGFGRIGRAVARIGKAFGMAVIIHDPAVGDACPPDSELVDLDDLFRRADVVSLHCPLTAETGELVNAPRLALMKRTALLINTSRGGLVDERALAAALNEGRVAGAGVDVLCVEPPPADSPLLRARNCSVTPHIAWATRAARARLMRTAVANVRAFIKGRPQNVVGG